MRRTLKSLKSTASIIQFPMNLGQPNFGLDLAPAKLIEGGLPKLLGGIGWRVKQVPPFVVESGNGRGLVTSDINAKNCHEVGRACEEIAKLIQAETKDNNFPLILGGDHCISIGTIPAIRAARNEFGVIWVDAHADINTPSTTISGNMHGMPVGFLLGLVEDATTIPGFSWFKPCLKPNEIVYIGIRDLDPAEKRTIKKLGVKAFTMYDVDKLGIGKVMEQALDYLDGKDLHLSFDIDAIDPFFAPHTGTAVTGGLSFREGNFICEELFRSGRLRSMELVEVDPAQHKGVVPTQTIDVALTLIGSAMGQKIL